MACALTAQVSPVQGRAGDAVSLQVNVAPPGVAAAVRVSVFSFGFEQPLAERAGAWQLDTIVPYEAQPSDYLLDVYALDGEGRRCGETRVAFTVLE